VGFRPKSRRRFIWATVLALSVCAVLATLWYQRDRTGLGYVRVHYKVQFKWTGGRLANVRFTDIRTAAEEHRPRFLAALSRLAAQEIPQVVVATGLKNAQGSAHIFIEGQGEPYLERWSDWQIPQLSDWVQAAQWWNLDELRRLLAEGVPVDAREIGDQRTALIWAAVDPRRGALYELARTRGTEPNPETVAFLLRAHADPNAKDRRGVTALMRASSMIAKTLLAAGANVNARDNDGLAPLMYASRNADIETMKLEIAAHADVNARDRNGWTALMHAASYGSPEALRILLAAGADKNVRNSRGETALDIAQRRGASEPSFRNAVELLQEPPGTRR
jgi:Ankyrin repeats (many copies)/Ankyrin repeat